MKPKRVFLDELNLTSKAYQVKVRVIEKGRAKTSPKKGVLYQSLLLEDEKGNRMRGALFGDQVEGYKDAFVYNGVYEFANAPIKNCDPQWKNNQSNLDFQMSFGSNTIIQPVDSTTSAVKPDYQTISQVPKVNAGEGKFDVLGILIYVERTCRKITTAQQRELWVREFIITDHSLEQPITVSAWKELAETDCDKLLPLCEKFGVIGLTAMKGSSYKGFSLTTSMSTTFIENPEGEKASSLRKWALHHHDVLASVQSRVADVRKPSVGRQLSTIVSLLSKKAQNTLQEERHWLRVYIADPDLEKIYAYIGCSICGKRTELEVGVPYNCESCSKPNCISAVRVTFNCEITDDTGKLPVTAFTDDCETLLGTTAAVLYNIKQTDDQELFQVIVERLQATSFMVQVGPKGTLSRNKVLQWVLKKIDLEKPETNTITLGESSKAGADSQSSAPTDSPPTVQRGKLVILQPDQNSALAVAPETPMMSTHQTYCPIPSPDKISAHLQTLAGTPQLSSSSPPGNSAPAKSSSKMAILHSAKSNTSAVAPETPVKIPTKHTALSQIQGKYLPIYRCLPTLVNFGALRRNRGRCGHHLYY